MDIASLGSASTATAASGRAPTSALGGDDFFKLLIAQLTNQDPLEPTSNEELLRQISSIREIELSSTLTDSLKSLTGQQRFTSAASLIGRYVTGQAEDGALPVSGVVSAVRFGSDGKAMLELESGQQIALEQVGTVMNASVAGNSLVGKMVTGIDASDPDDPRIIEGIVVSMDSDDAGRIRLDLDTGQELPLDWVVSVKDASGTLDATFVE
jgi:flagellar basal-body rod modification protein FlgD